MTTIRQPSELLNSEAQRNPPSPPFVESGCESLIWLPTPALALTLSLSLFYLFCASRSYFYSYMSLTRSRDPADPPPAENAWVTVLLPVYNEPSPLLNRLLRACTSFQFGRYDVVVADDSTSPETLDTLREWQSNGKIKVVHRAQRDGFKGAALQNAISQLGPRTTHLLVFDADFTPHPDVLSELLTSFQDDTVAAVQGRQSHSLNASQNWITKAVHASSAAGSITELSARSRLGSFIQLGGTVMMIRRDVLARVGGFKSHLAEDFELTLRLYLASYKVLYREDVSVAAECPSRFLHVLRQNLRWSQGITSALREHFTGVLKSRQLRRREKIDLLLFGSFHLQAVLFMTTNIILFTFPLLFHTPSIRTALAATPVALYLALSGPTCAAVGLYKDGYLRRAHWILYANLLYYLIVPFQAYAALKGLFSKRGFWHRTPKTGLCITKSYRSAKATGHSPDRPH